LPSVWFLHNIRVSTNVYKRCVGPRDGGLAMADCGLKDAGRGRAAGAKWVKRTQFSPGRRRMPEAKWPGSKPGNTPWPLTPGTPEREPVCGVPVRAWQKTLYGVTTNKRADLAPTSGSVPRGLCHLERVGLSQAEAECAKRTQFGPGGG
jgi:hypothetical protein